MSRTEELIKPYIEQLVNERVDVLRPASSRGLREYPLYIEDRSRPFFADFACRLPDDAWLFIEDDDASRALKNLTKYWMWVEKHAVGEDVHLVHLIGPGAHDLVTFAGKRAEAANPHFHYELIAVKDWAEPSWRETLRHVLDRIVAAGGDGAEQLGPLRDDPAIGMWKGREDMKDSVAWVRELRRTEWERLR